MTRGRMVLIMAGGNGKPEVAISTEFNGDMYIHGGYGMDVLSMFTEHIRTFEQFDAMVRNFNESTHKYEEDELTFMLYAADTDYMFADGATLDVSGGWLSDYTYLRNASGRTITVRGKNGEVPLADGAGLVMNCNSIAATRADGGWSGYIEEGFVDADELMTQEETGALAEMGISDLHDRYDKVQSCIMSYEANRDTDDEADKDEVYDYDTVKAPLIDLLKNAESWEDVRKIKYEEMRRNYPAM